LAELLVGRLASRNRKSAPETLDKEKGFIRVSSG
jgi:hypothetical protein